MFHLIGIICAFAIYFLPSILAGRRYHPSSTAIFLVNFFLGWTGIGWAICLVWALSGSAPRVVVLQPAMPTGRAFYCTRCGTPSTGEFCPNCGART